jgi:hypothetical protein
VKRGANPIRGGRRGEIYPAVTRAAGEPLAEERANGLGSNPTRAPAGFFQQAQPRLVEKIQQNLRGKADGVFSGDGGGDDGSSAPRSSSSTPPRRLILASHGRLMWFDVDTRTSEVIHEGRGVYYGVFPADPDGNSIWVVSRPHNWRPQETKAGLYKLHSADRESLKAPGFNP